MEKGVGKYFNIYMEMIIIEFMYTLLRISNYLCITDKQFQNNFKMKIKQLTNI